MQQITGAIYASGALQLRLCSDAAGVTAVNTFNIPPVGVVGNWHCFTIDLGTNLGSSIQSIALYLNTDYTSQAFLFSSLITQLVALRTVPATPPTPLPVEPVRVNAVVLVTITSHVPLALVLVV